MVLAVKSVDLSIGYIHELTGKPVWVVRNVDLEVLKGEVLCLIGESGCGKTTLASAIAGILPPHSVTSGRLYVLDRLVIDGDRREFNGVRGRLVTYIPQNPGTSLNPYLRVKDQFRKILGSLHKCEEALSKSIATEYLKMVGLDEDVLDMYPHELSGGMQQRVTIALALATGAQIVIADEPTSAVDAHLKYQIIELLNKLARNRELTLIVVTHEIHLARRMCSKMAIMYYGKIVELGNVSAISREPKHPYTIALLEATPVLGRVKQLSPLPGEPPDFSSEVTGCPLYPRCPSRIAGLCKREPPFAKVDEAGHYVRCWLVRHETRR